MGPDLSALLAGKRKLRLERGYTLRLLSALEILEARHEAAGLAAEDRERALCSNACLLARALERRGKPVFPDGPAALAALTPGQVERLAGRWAAFHQAENPSPEDGEERAALLKKALSTRLMSAFAGACSRSLAHSPQRHGPGR